MASLCSFITGALQGALGIIIGFFGLAYIGYFLLSRGEEDCLPFSKVLEGAFNKHLNPHPDRVDNPVVASRGSVKAKEAVEPQPFTVGKFSEEAKPQDSKLDRKGVKSQDFVPNRAKAIANIRQRMENEGHKFQELSKDAQEEFLNFFYLLVLLEVLQNPSTSKGVRYYFFEDDRQLILETAVPEIASEEQKSAYRNIEGSSRKWMKTEYEDRIHYKLPLKRVGNKVVCR